MQPKVAFVIDELEVGGSQRQLYLMATGLASRGWPVTVICLQPILAMAEEFTAAGVPVHLLRKRTVLDVQLLLALRRFFTRERIDIVHAFSSTAEFFACVAARACGRRFVASIRNYNERLPRLHRAAKRFACLLADAVVANSQAGATAAVRNGVVPSRKTHVIPNGVVFQPLPLSREEARRQLGITDPAFVALSVGRLVREKGYDVTLEIAKRVSPQFPQALFLIAGDGPFRDTLAQRLAALGLEGRVRFLGERRDIGRLLAAADVYLNTSVSEGLSNSIMEAMAAGKVVLATAVGGTTELIDDGNTGLLFPSGDVEAGVQRLERLAKDVAMRETLGAQAQRMMHERHGVESMVSRVEQMYRGLSGAWEKRPPQELSRRVG